jgi:hypothetical protein
MHPHRSPPLSPDQSAISTLLGALSSGGAAGVSAAESAVAEAERDGGWPRGVLPAACYFNLLDVAHQAGDKAGAVRISSLIRPVLGTTHIAGSMLAGCLSTPSAESIIPTMSLTTVWR